MFLTFDDGPTPLVTDFVLDTLAQSGVCATFFCLGENVRRHQGQAGRILSEGHQLANHGYSHLDGWRISKEQYLGNIQQGKEVLSVFSDTDSFLFRPPYGHFKKAPGAILWSLMSGDFDHRLPKEKCLSQLTSQTKSSDIVVFHDNGKSFDKLKWVLPRYLEFCLQKGFRFGLVPKEL